MSLFSKKEKEKEKEKPKAYWDGFQLWRERDGMLMAQIRGDDEDENIIQLLAPAIASKARGYSYDLARWHNGRQYKTAEAAKAAINRVYIKYEIETREPLP